MARSTTPAAPQQLLRALQLARPVDWVTKLVPVVFLTVLCLAMTAAWTEARTEVAYLRAAEPIPAVLSADGAWVATAGEPGRAHARAYAVAEVERPRERWRWMGLVGLAGSLSLGLALTRCRGDALPVVAGRPVPLVPTLA